VDKKNELRIEWWLPQLEILGKHTKDNDENGGNIAKNNLSKSVGGGCCNSRFCGGKTKK